MIIIQKTLKYYKSAGLKKTLIKILTYILNIVLLKNYKQNKLKKEILSEDSIEERFSKIYNYNYWFSDESRSGTGSDLANTKNIRKHLPLIVKRFNIESIFDAPCGDLNWMYYVLKNMDISYHGSDIVKKIVDSNNDKFKNNKIKFSKKNIITEKLPNYDLMICRDCLFHFSYKDIFLFMNNFISSKIKYLLTTSHVNNINDFKNKNILTGDYRLLDLFSEPFNFEKNYLYIFDDRDYLEVKNVKQMYLFSRIELEKSVKKLNTQKFISEGF